ncbi:MAG: DUF2808 domain-containing protein [Leptolyngbyaceae cyanobacterium bins.59]|nr:DUF2808 domain-containing protein [Leptolyngbyaceae cyanobacterium bins.59]
MPSISSLGFTWGAVGAVLAPSLILSLLPLPSQAIQLADGTVYFAYPPRLVEASSSFRTIRAWGATYFFTLAIPPNAGESLQRVTIALQQGGDPPDYKLQESKAFEGTRWEQGKAIPLAPVVIDATSQTLSVVFNPPVEPGKTVTIALRPRENPSLRGTYLFGVTAFPTGEKAYGQFLGFGRLTFTGGHRR